MKKIDFIEIIVNDSGYKVRIWLNKVLKYLTELIDMKADRSDITKLEEEISNVSTMFKGYYTYINNLVSAHPIEKNKAGFSAWVGEPFPGLVYKVTRDGGSWTNTGEKPTQEEIDLSEYAKKVDLDVKAEKKTIYNISQINNKYDYATSIIARNAVLANYQALGIIVSYQLVSGEWITEQHLGINVASWSAKENWKFIGGIAPEDIYQKVDSTIDKPISPKGVLDGLLGVKGIGYKENSSTPQFKNIITSYDYVVGKYLSTTNEETTQSGYSYNPAYFPVEPSTVYLHNNKTLNPKVLFYKEDKTLISTSATATKFTTPPTAAFIRYNRVLEVQTEYYIYKAPTASTSGDIGVNLAVGDIIGAVETDVQINTGSILTPDVLVESKGIDAFHNISVNGWYHTDYMPVVGDMTYSTNLDDKAAPFCWYYDANKYAIDKINSVKTFTTPINAAFIRINTTTQNLTPYYIKPGTSGGNAFYIPNLVVPSENIIEGSSSKAVDYTSLGDSISFGLNATLPFTKLISLRLKGEFTNLAVSSLMVTGANQLITRINLVPDGFRGFITLMIGINDFRNNISLGDVTAVLAKNFDALDVSASFAEAFRFCLETLLRKAPSATVLVILPLKAGKGKELDIDKYRQVEREICEYYAIPYSELYKRCTIAPLTYPTLLPDELHPNDAGHREIDRVLYKEVLMYLK